MHHIDSNGYWAYYLEIWGKMSSSKTQEEDGLSAQEKEQLRKSQKDLNDALNSIINGPSGKEDDKSVQKLICSLRTMASTLL